MEMGNYCWLIISNNITNRFGYLHILKFNLVVSVIKFIYGFMNLLTRSKSKTYRENN